MKKTILFVAILILAYSEIVAQCTYCGGTTNTGNNSSAIGTNTVSTGNSSFASGFGSEVTDNYTTAMGFYAKATYSKGVALGSAVKATVYKSVVIGSGDWNANVYLENNVPRSLMVGFQSRYPTLFVSESPMSAYHNKTGRIGIGNVTSPQAKLHLRADEGEEAAVFIEPNSWDGGDTATLFLGTKNNGIGADNQEGMMYHTEEYHVFKGGDIYIEDIDKGIIMKSPDGKCWRGTLDNSGSLHFTRMDACPCSPASVPESQQNQKDNIKLYPNPAGDIITVDVNQLHFKNKVLTASVINLNGTVLASRQISGSSVRFYIGDLPAGNYSILISGNKFC